MNKDEIKKRLSELQVVYRETVTLRSGNTSDYYCDIKKSYGDPKLLNAIASEVVKMISHEVTCIAASGYGGLPLAALVSTQSGKKFSAIRGTPKNHGKGGVIDGYIPQKYDVVVIVDDVLTSGSSIKETLSSLKKTGAHVKSAVVVVNRGDPELIIPYTHIFHINELV